MSANATFVPQVLVNKDDSVGVLVEQNGQLVVKSMRDRDVSIGRLPTAEEKDACKKKIERYIDNLHGLAAGTRFRCKGLAALSQACSKPAVVGREVQVGDVVEGPDRTVAAGLLLSVDEELSYTDDYGYLMGQVFTATSSVYTCRLDTLRHASAKTLIEMAHEALFQEAQWRGTTAQHEAEIDCWRRVAL
jgi:hypothetical protein